VLPILRDGTVLDGELTAGSFHRTMAVLRGAWPFEPSLRLVVFDLPVFAGLDLRVEPWENRRQRLELLAQAFTYPLELSPVVEPSADLSAAIETGYLEGIVLKDRTSDTALDPGAAGRKLSHPTGSSGTGRGSGVMTGAERDISFEGNRMVVLVSADSTNGALTVIEETVPANWAPPMHIHHRAAEFLYVLEGMYTFRLDDQEIAGEPGTHIAIPAGTRHTWRSGPAGGRMLIVFAPGGMEAYFAELAAAEASNSGKPPDRAGRLARYGMEILDPT
jgi:quercetin dioxygenase-like cupin family protein